jgi:hypothetical protein
MMIAPTATFVATMSQLCTNVVDVAVDVDVAVAVV